MHRKLSYLVIGVLLGGIDVAASTSYNDIVRASMQQAAREGEKALEGKEGQKALQYAIIHSGELTRKAVPSIQPTAKPTGTITRTGRLQAGDYSYETGAGEFYADYWEFELRAGDVVNVSLSSTSFDPAVSTFFPDHEETFLSNDDGGPGLDSYLSFEVPFTGTWVVAVSSSIYDPRGSGSYTLTVTTVPSGAAGSGSSTDTITRTGRLEAGDVVLEGTIRDYYADFWEFELTAGDQVSLSLSSTSFDPNVTVFPDHEDSEDFMLSDDDSGPGLDAYLSFEVPFTGTWIVGVSPSFLVQRGSGSYVLTVTTVTAESPAAPVARFTASPTRGMVPLSVSFTNTSTGTGVSYAWSFGDGGTSTLVNPSHTYTTAGIYTVRLTATNAGGTRSATRTITVTPTPAKLFVRAISGNRRVASPYRARVGRTLRFEVFSFTLADSSDMQPLTDYDCVVPAALGTAPRLGEVELTTVAGVRDAIHFQATGATADYEVITIPHSINRVEITPTELTIEPGQRQTFRAKALDRYGNPVFGKRFGWHVVGDIGTIDSYTGDFVAADNPGDGYVIAVVNTVLIFADAGTTVQGASKVIVGHSLPGRLALLPNAPNPFNSATEIRFELSAAGPVRLAVFDLAGQEVERIMEGSLSAGMHKIPWNATGRASGIYVVRLEAGPSIRMRKMLLLR